MEVKSHSDKSTRLEKLRINVFVSNFMAVVFVFTAALFFLLPVQTQAGDNFDLDAAEAAILACMDDYEDWSGRPKNVSRDDWLFRWLAAENEGDPVEYHRIIAKVVQCYQEKASSAEEYFPFYWLRSTSYLTSHIEHYTGFDVTECQTEGYRKCNSKYDTCSNYCGGDSFLDNSCMTACSQKQEECANKTEKGCEDKFLDKLEEHALSIKDDSKKGDQQETDPRYNFCQPPDTTTQSFNKFGIPVANAQIYTNYTVVTYIEGEVLVKTKDSPVWTPAYKGQRLMLGDEINTKRNGKCEVKFANSAKFRMRPLSKLSIPKQSPDYCDLNFTGKAKWLIGGSLKESAVRHWREKQRELMRIKTPTTSTGIRDTDSGLRSMIDKEENKYIATAHADSNDTVVYMNYDETTEQTDTYVDKGFISVSDPTGQSAVTLTEGEHITVEKGEEPEESNIVLSKNVEDKWWEEFDDGFFWWYVLAPVVFLGVGFFVLIAVIVAIIKRLMKPKSSRRVTKTGTSQKNQTSPVNKQIKENKPGSIVKKLAAGCIIGFLVIFFLIVAALVVIFALTVWIL